MTSPYWAWLVRLLLVRSALLLLLVAGAASGQVMDATRLGDPVVLHQGWRFHAGDDPAWSQPGFDDSRWQSIDSSKTWDELGLQRVRGYVWFRGTIRIPDRMEDLSLFTDDDGPYEVFADGERVGGLGKFPPSPHVMGSPGAAYPIGKKQGEVHVAVRMWIDPVFFHVGRVQVSTRLGTVQGIDAYLRDSSNGTLVHGMPIVLTVVLEGLLCTGIAAIFFFQRDRFEYFFLALCLAFHGALDVIRIFRALTPTRFDWGDYANNLMSALVAVIVGEAAWILFTLGVRKTVEQFVPDMHWADVTIEPGQIFYFLFQLSIGALVLARFQKSRVAQAQAKAEIEAARSMQEAMAPQKIAVEGFAIESVYMPAQEVGGDFLQLVPGDDGSLFVAVGDVSGKGLKAAMLVSMIVGLMRRSVALSRSPATVLQDVNAFLMGSTDGRFATCCCALLHADGSLALANAGHLSPYCEGREVELPGRLASRCCAGGGV